VSLTFAITYEGRISEPRLALIERHDDGADFLQEALQLADHGRMFAGAHDNMRFEQAHRRDATNRVRLQRRYDALALRFVLEPG
jgi:hypothetical protein